MQLSSCLNQKERKRDKLSGRVAHIYIANEKNGITRQGEEGHYSSYYDYLVSWLGLSLLLPPPPYIQPILPVSLLIL